MGDEAADRLELVVAILTAQALGKSQYKIPLTRNSSRLDVEFAEMAKPSPGYESLLVEMGWDRFAARGLAKFAIRRARKQAKESKLYREVFKDIRYLAQGPRQKAALVRCAGRLHDSWEATPIPGDILYRANVDEFEFMRLLKLAAEGHEVNFNRITKVAVEIESQLSIKRGPKMRPASVAHEFFSRAISGLNWESGLGRSRIVPQSMSTH